MNTLCKDCPRCGNALSTASNNLLGLTVQQFPLRLNLIARVCLIYAVSLALASCGRSQVLGPADGPAQLIKAFREGYVHNVTTYEYGVSSTQSNLVLEQVLWSQRPPLFPATLFTHLTLDRLGSLKAQCLSWRGPVSAALYLSLVQPRDTPAPSNISAAASAGADLTGLRRRSLHVNGSNSSNSSNSSSSSTTTTIVRANDSNSNVSQSADSPVAGQVSVTDHGADVISIADSPVNASAIVTYSSVQGSGSSSSVGSVADSGGEQHMASSWASLTPMSQAKLLNATASMREFFSMMDALPESCTLSLMLFWEVFDSEKARILYPVNILRNYARLQVRTKLLAMIDVDLIVSSSLAMELQSPARVRYYEGESLKGKVIVLPAFDVVTRINPAVTFVKMDKQSLHRHWLQQEVRQFKLKNYPSGHGATNYGRWFKTAELYNVQYRSGYEPWFLAHWDVLPWYDVRYRGYGFNKVVAVASIKYFKYTFAIHPNSWLVHLPHEQTEARLAMTSEASRIRHKKTVSKLALYKVTRNLFTAAKLAMQKGTYAPVVDHTLLRVYRALPWLQQRPMTRMQTQ